MIDLIGQHLMDESILSSRYETPGSKLDAQLPVDQVGQIVKNLRESFMNEKSVPLQWRIDQLSQLRNLLVLEEDALCEAMLGDLGKSRFEGFATEIATTIGEIDNAMLNLHKWMKPEYKANTPLTWPSTSFTQRDPLGVVLIFGSWNYPVYLSLNPIVGAIAGGNCVLLKPGSYAKNTSRTIKRLIAKYMDGSCIQCIEGNREITKALLEEKFDKIFFTGSGFVGRIIAVEAAKQLTPCVLELGGKSPCIVDTTSSTHLEYTVRRIVWGCFTNCGQTCVRPDFLLVNEKMKHEFLAEMKRVIQNFYSENPKESAWFGRCINKSAFKRLSGFLENHKDNVVFGGSCNESEKYIAPTLLNFGSNLDSFRDSVIMQDEIFGPIVPIAFYSKLEEVVHFIKTLKTGSPLAVYAFGTCKEFQDEIRQRTSSGSLVLNDTFIHLANHELPFGGIGNSGMGSYHGKYSFDCFTHEKAVLIKHPSIEALPLVRDILGIRFPPYTRTKQSLLRAAFHKRAGHVFHFFYENRIADITKVILLCICFKLLGFRITRK